MGAKRNIAYINANTDLMKQPDKLAFDTAIMCFIEPKGGKEGLANGELMMTGMLDRPGDIGSIIKGFKDAGKTVLVSFPGGAFEANDTDVLFGADDKLNDAGRAFVDQMATIVAGGRVTIGGSSYDLGPGFDGIDWDLEWAPGDWNAYAGPDAPKWAARVADLSIYAKEKLGANGLITHAPQTPYLLNGDDFSDTQVYSMVMKQAGNAIDWLNMQFYNNGEDAEVTKARYAALTGADAKASGIDASQIVLGKPLSAQGAGTGYLAPDVLIPLIQELNDPDFGGVFGWQLIYDDNPVTESPAPYDRPWGELFAGAMA